MKQDKKFKIAITLTVVLTLFTTLSQAQFLENTWQGDTPGRSTDWNIPSNWSNHHVPTDEESVIIPNLTFSTNRYPIIQEEVFIQSLEIHNDAKLTIETRGILNIDGYQAIEHGIFCLGTIDNKGTIIVKNTILEPILIEGHGVINDLYPIASSKSLSLKNISKISLEFQQLLFALLFI